MKSIKNITMYEIKPTEMKALKGGFWTVIKKPGTGTSRPSRPTYSTIGF